MIDLHFVSIEVYSFTVVSIEVGSFTVVSTEVGSFTVEVECITVVSTEVYTCNLTVVSKRASATPVGYTQDIQKSQDVRDVEKENSIKRYKDQL